jgi:DNA polymerase III epsilon subunit-like protein
VVGHDIKQDIKFLKSIGVNVMGSHGVFQTADTKDLYQAMQLETFGRGLGTVLEALEIPHSNLHNAGNDAAYTLQAMVSIAVRSCQGVSVESSNAITLMKVGSNEL